MKKSFYFGFAAIICFSLPFGKGRGWASPSPSAAMTDEGNALLKKGHFSAAREVWEKILQQEPDNANVNFKLAMCYFNSLDEKHKALPYLKKAAKNLSTQYDFFSTTGKTAPYDVLYFIGETFLAANQPDSAMLFLFRYDDKFSGNPPIPTAKAIRNCINAKNSAKSPRDVTLKNPGKNVNSVFAETNPVLTIDHSVMFFASRKNSPEGNKQISPVTGKFDGDIYFTRKDASGKWDAPSSFKWNTGSDETPLCLTADGLTLYFCREVNEQHDIFQSNYVDKVWSQPKPLSEVNSPFNETGATVSADGKYLYISSDREGGQGKFDIYRCVKKGSKWGKPQNLGLAINTSFSEISPFINPNGKTLFFSSNGNKDGIGGYDIFYAELNDNGTWTQPQNMGFPVNTTMDDIGFCITGGGNRYYATVRDENNSYDIFKIEGGGFAIENIDVSGQVVTLTKEMSVSDVVEVEKTVEKEVEVVETIETTVEVIKEVEKIDLEKEQAKMDSMLTLARKEAGNEKLQAEALLAKARVDSIAAFASMKTAEAEKIKAEAEIKKAEADKARADADKAKSDAARVASEAAKAKSDAVIAAAQKAKDEAASAKANAAAKIAEANKAKSDAAAAQAEAAKTKAESDKAKAAENKAKLEADKALAEQKNLELKNQLAENEKPKHEAMKAQAEAAKAKSEEKIAQLQNAKNLADKAKADADAKKAEATAVSAEALKAKAEADKSKAAENKAKLEADKALAEQKNLELKNQLAENEKPKHEALKAKSDADKAKAEADKLKAQETIAAANKAKSDAVIAAAQKAKADADALKSKADIAASEKAKADAAKVQAEAQKTQALADKAKSDADKAAADASAKKSAAEIAAAEKAKADAIKAEADAKKAEELAKKAQADAEAKKAQLEILKLNPPQPKIKSPAPKTGG